MRYLLIALLFISMPSLADRIVCYQNGKVIYKANVHNVGYADGIISFVENGSKQSVFTNSDCLIRIP